MSYQVLARKWRPRTFSEMVGQEHVLRAIINALDNDRLHHAFLFTGTRGVGKTTIARILAKSLNCEQGVSSTPCGQCVSCQEIDDGRFIDLIEVDAASRTKVEDTRELLDNVQYAPTRGRYKVYLIDEVHMLSKHSFNALLKTLEEPPPHIKFLLATTDPQRLPVTILSRCLQFSLKRLPVELIAGHLEHILTAEQIEFEGAALAYLARAADGSMRDALSLLDQAIAFGGGHLTVSDVCAMLGSIDHHHVVDLLKALAAADGMALLAAVQQAAQQAPDFSALLEELLSLLHQIALCQCVPAAVTDSDRDYEAIIALAEQITAEDVQLYYQIGLNGRRDLPLAPDLRSGFEMTLLRMLAFRPAGSTVVTSDAGKTKVRPQKSVVPTSSSASSPSAPAQSPVKPPAATQQPSNTSSSVTLAETSDWTAMVEQMKLSGMLYQLAVNCELQGQQGDKLQLRLDEAHAYLGSANRKQRLEQQLQQHFGAALTLNLVIGAPQNETPALRQHREQSDRQQAAEESIQNDVNVQKLQDVFNAQIVPESIQPVGSD